MFLLGQGDRSAYVMTFSSYPGPQAAFGLFGVSYILGDRPLMSENALYVDQVLMFNGWPPGLNLYFTATRPVYAFLASLVAPFAGVMGAQMLLNLAAWAGAAYLAWRFALAVFADHLAALLAVVFVAGGLGFAIHSHDYSPHLVPFTVYFLIVVGIFESRVWESPQPLNTHAAIGVALALGALTHTLGLLLIAGYALVAWRHNRSTHLVAALTIALSSHLAYTAWLNALNSAALGTSTWTAVDGPEIGRLRLSLMTWLSLLTQPVALARALFNAVAQFSFFEWPPVIALGLLSWRVLPRHVRWFFLVFFALPFLGGMAWVFQSTARGYLVYGTAILLYVPLAAAFAARLHRGGTQRALAAVALAALVGTQVWWSTAFLWNYAFPAKAFFGFGYTEWMDDFASQFAPPPAISMTGAEATPRLFGGGASLADGGMLVSPAHEPLRYSLALAALSRLVLVGYAVALVALLAPRAWRRRGVIAVLTILAIVPIASSAWLRVEHPAIVDTFTSMAIAPGESLNYDVNVSEDFRSALRNAQIANGRVQVIAPGIAPPYHLRVSAGEALVVASQDGAMVQPSTVSVHELVLALDRRPVLTMAVTVPASQAKGTGLFGWQRNGLPGRTLSSSARQLVASRLLPMFEVRVLDDRGRPILIGF